MGKKRKGRKEPSEPKGPKEYNPKDARLGPISTYEDVADSEDEYHAQRDQIMFDDGPSSKRRKKSEILDDFLEDSDEEILGYDDQDEYDESEVGVNDLSRTDKKGTVSRSTIDDKDDGEDGDHGWWGSSRKEYYDADKIETEADAIEEEKEARRLQKQKLSKMREEDFQFENAEWKDTGIDKDQDTDIVTEVLEDINITDEMGSEERYRLLQTRYPELDHLAEELLQLQPLLVELQKEANAQPERSLAVVKYRTLGCYVASLAMYFAVLTSPTRDEHGSAKAMDPIELRNHEVMETLLQCREAWQKVEHLSSPKCAMAVSGIMSPPEHDVPLPMVEEPANVTQKSRKAKTDKDLPVFKAQKAKAIEDSIADLADLVGELKKPRNRAKPVAGADDSHSDFGEEDTMDAKTAANKAARKKSLRFYTSQIVQKSNKRTDASRDAGGDMDIPHRERLKDRQARLNAEAERRGQKTSKHGVDLGDDSDEEDTYQARAARDDENQYYDKVTATSKRKQADKAAKYAAHAKAGKGDRVVEMEEVGEDGKRRITYAIQKNKGLTPKRGKLNRNPRTKKRMQYEAAKKKDKSRRAVYSGGEGKGGYQGETTGIKPGLIKSRKL